MIEASRCRVRNGSEYHSRSAGPTLGPGAGLLADLEGGVDRPGNRAADHALKRDSRDPQLPADPDHPQTFPAAGGEITPSQLVGGRATDPQHDSSFGDGEQIRN